MAWHCQAFEHEPNHCEMDEGCDGCGVAFEISHQAAVSADPGNAGRLAWQGCRWPFGVNRRPAQGRLDRGAPAQGRPSGNCAGAPADARRSVPAISTPCPSCSRPLGRLRVARPSAESSTILARCRSRCCVFVERAKPSSSACSSFVNVIGVAAGMLFMHP
jgi:hypothetical protein